MLDALLAYRFGLGRVLSFPIAIGATFYFSNELGWPWYFSYSAGIAVLLIVPVLWVIVLGFLVACRSAIAWVLALVSTISASVYMSDQLGWPWYFWSPTALVIFIAVPALWGIFLGLLERRTRRW
jgi:hypothetical protein